MRAESGTYTTIAIILHWVIAVFLVSLVFYGWAMEDLRDALFAGEASLDEVRQAYNWHKTAGLTVLVLSLVRLGWRLTHMPPPLPAHMTSWEKVAATATHWAFYALMIGMPLMGWITASASDQPSWLLNNPDLVLPRLPVPQSDSVQEIAGSIHGAGGWAILSLLALHVGAALKHQFMDRDGLLGRMIPVLKGKP
ncbi:cytochrome b [Maricaulis sp. CAU 1757]